MQEIDFFGIPIIVCPETYPPSEDTELLAQSALKYVKPGMRIIEIGVGTGAIAVLLAKKGAIVYGTDISEKAIECAYRNAIKNNVSLNLAVGNFFGPFSNLRFDMVLFNPPYLPSDEYDYLLKPYEKLALIGGKYGYEITLEFIRQSRNKLRLGGKILIVISTLTKPEKIINYARSRGFRVKIEAYRSFFFEKIMVLLLTKNTT
ncbi:MAG: HemK2/MTQ2 family protein methyltransferase [Candidatus Njordarchaeales archaeon]